MKHFLMGYHGISHLSLVFSWYAHSPKGLCVYRQIDHFTVVGKVTWRLTGSEAGVDLVLIQTSLLLLCKSSCSHAN